MEATVPEKSEDEVEVFLSTESGEEQEALNITITSAIATMPSLVINFFIKTPLLHLKV